MGFIILLLPLVLVFFMMQSQRKKAAQQQQLLATLTEGDDVMTTAGMYGTLTWVGKEEAFVEIADGVEIHIAKAAIARKVDMTTTEAARVEAGDAMVVADDAAVVGGDAALLPDDEAIGDASRDGGRASGASSLRADDAVSLSDESDLTMADDGEEPMVEPKRRRFGSGR